MNSSDIKKAFYERLHVEISKDKANNPDEIRKERVKKRLGRKYATLKRGPISEEKGDTRDAR